MMSFEEARALSNSVISYRDDRQIILRFPKKYNGREFTEAELSNELRIEKSRILVCVNNIMKQADEIQSVGSGFNAAT